MAGDRRGRRHRRRHRLVRTVRARHARRHCGRGHRHSRCAERAVIAHRPRPFSARLTAPGRKRAERQRGRTRLFVQLIDFLAVRRRPEAKKFFERFLAITDRHRAALGDATLSDAAVRERLGALSEDELKRVLTPQEWEALRFGYRERVTDVEAAAHPRSAADAAGPVRRGRKARGSRGLRRRRAALRPRLHHGVVSLAHQHARRRLWRHARTIGCGCRSRCWPKCGAR